MDLSQAIKQSESKLRSATTHFQDEFKKIRTGRAHPAMLDNVIVSAVGSIIVPEPQLLQITPFDLDNLQPIAEAIRSDQSLDLTPTDDGRVVRVQLPPMTAENRQAMVKLLHQKLEEALIAARNIRHEAVRQADEAEKTKQISKDERFRFGKDIDELLAKQKTELEKIVQAKEQEILTV